MNRVLENRFYYLDNFQQVLDWIGKRYSDLLIADELTFIERFGSLPAISRALLVRMVMRKGDLFRSSKLELRRNRLYPASGAPLGGSGLDRRPPITDAGTVVRLAEEARDIATIRLFPAQQGSKKG
jgi:hypothetical protein